MVARRNPHLRQLAAAYEQDLITAEQYQALRGKQLSAIQFDKEYPALPRIIRDCEVEGQAQVLTEAPAPKQKRKMPWIILALVIVALLVAYRQLGF